MKLKLSFNNTWDFNTLNIKLQFQAENFDVMEAYGSIYLQTLEISEIKAIKATQIKKINSKNAAWSSIVW